MCSEGKSNTKQFSLDFYSWITKTMQNLDPRFETFSSPPIFTKFLGDGFLYLWEIPPGIVANEFYFNLINYIRDIIIAYNPFCNDAIEAEDDVRKITFFYQDHKKTYPDIPKILRAGMSTGEVEIINFTDAKSVDYLGNCINLSSRLQKIHSKIRFAAELPAMDTKHAELLLEYEALKMKVRGFRKKITILLPKSELEDIGENEQCYMFDM